MTAIDDLILRALHLELPIALDSSALISYLADEEPIVRYIAPIVESEELDVLVSTITISEALVRTADRFGREPAEIALRSIENLPAVRIVAFDQELIVESAITRARTRLKLPDAAIIATARIAGAVAIIGNDRAWQNKPLGIQYIHLDDVLRDDQS